MPVAIRSTLGFVLSGPTTVTNLPSSSSALISQLLGCQAEFIDPNEALTSHLDRFLTLETLDPDLELSQNCENLDPGIIKFVPDSEVKLPGQIRLLCSIHG